MIEKDGKRRSGRILVADDEEINRAVLAAILRKEGHDVVEASDGGGAVGAVDAGGVDLVLLDVVMPGMDGMEACRRIRENERHAFLPIVFVTAHGDRESRIRGKAAGADDFLTKPVDPTELLARVGNLLKAKAYHDLRARQQEFLEAEVERMRAQLIHADRLATLGNLAAGVGHELKNAATMLCGILPFVREASEKKEPVGAQDMKALETAALHVSTHASFLLNYGRPGPDVTAEEDLRDVVTRTLGMLRTAGKTKYVAVETEMPETPVVAAVNRVKIEQVLVNLVGNAVDALDGLNRDRKAVRVSLRQQGGRAVCRVEDNGCGMPAAVREKLFQPYFTTKPPGKGNGLGLPVIRNIVESYGGKVAVESEEGKGTAFVFDLPLKP